MKVPSRRAVRRWSFDELCPPNVGRNAVYLIDVTVLGCVSCFDAVSGSGRT